METLVVSPSLPIALLTVATPGLEEIQVRRGFLRLAEVGIEQDEPLVCKTGSHSPP